MDGYWPTAFIAEDVTIDGLYVQKHPDYNSSDVITDHAIIFGETELGMTTWYSGYASKNVTLKNINIASNISMLSFHFSGATLTEEVTFTDDVIPPLYFGYGIINNNAVESAATISKLTFYWSNWNPTSGADLNNVQSISFSGGYLYTDNLSGYDNELNIIWGNLAHGEGINEFETHYLPINTKITSFNLNYSLDDKAYYMAMHDDILRFQKGSEEVLVQIADGGNGGFFKTVDYSSMGYSIIGNQVYIFNTKYDFTGRTYATPDGIATIHYNMVLDEITDGIKKYAVDYKLHSININPGKYFSLIGNIGSASEYIDLEGGFTGDGGLNLVAETDENGIVDTEIYLGGDANIYTGATIVNSGVTLHLESADTISASTELKLYGNASFVVDDSTGTGNEFPILIKLLWWVLPARARTAQHKRRLAAAAVQSSLTGQANSSASSRKIPCTPTNRPRQPILHLQIPL